MTTRVLQRLTGHRTRVPVRQYSALLLKYLRQQKGIVALASVLILTNIGLQLVNPQIMRYFIDEAVAGSPLRNLMAAAGSLRGCSAGAAVRRRACDVHERSGRVETPPTPCGQTSRATRYRLTCRSTTATRRGR